LRTFITKLRLNILRVTLIVTLLILVILTSPYDPALHALIFTALVIAIMSKLTYSLPITLVLSLTSYLVFHENAYLALMILGVPYLSRVSYGNVFDHYLCMVLYVIHTASMLYYVGVNTWYFIVVTSVYIVVSITYLVQVMSSNDIILSDTLLRNLAKALIVSFIILIIAWIIPQIQATVIFGSIAILLLLTLDRIT